MKLHTRMLSGLALAVAVLGFGAEQASAFGFTCITNNSATDCAIGEAQLTGSFSDLGGGQVELLISNTGPLASVVGQVYLDDGVNALFTGIASLLSVVSVDGVNFSSPATPGDLPGGNTVGFTADLSAGAVPPPPTTGVGPGETLGVVLNLVNGKTLADVLAELGSGDLRVGLHVIAFADGGSESFVNGGGGTPIPEPTAALVFAAGTLLVGSSLRRRTA